MNRIATTLFVAAAAFAVALPAGAVVQSKAGLDTNQLHEYRTFNPAVQTELTSKSQAFKRFTEVYGPGWRVDWDERSLTPLRIYGKPISVVHRKADKAAVTAAAHTFLSTVSGLLGVPSSDLTLSVATKVHDTWFLQWDVSTAGIPVENATVEMRIKSGAITLLKVNSHPQAATATTLAQSLSRQDALTAATSSIQPLAGPAKVAQAGRLVVLPVAHATHYEYRLAWVNEVTTSQIAGHFRTHVDASTGEVLRRENLVRFVSGTITGRVEPRTVGDTMQDLVMPNIAVTINGTSGTANQEGVFDINATGAATVVLSGKFTDVRNSQGGEGQGNFTANASPADFTIADPDATQAEIAAYKHTETVKAWTRIAAPWLTWADSTLRVNVNLQGSCNAYWDGQATNFFRAGGQCNNIGRIADVVYHEYGHGFHQNVAVAGTISGAIGEGTGDYIAVTLTNDPDMAKGFFTNGGHIREADNNKHYPEDLSGQVHADGEIWVGTMWDLRNLLKARYGDVDGVKVSDALFSKIMRSGPRFDDLYSEALLADDDDNDLQNGTPNQCEIDEAFGNRGLGGPGGGTGSFLPVSHDEITGFQEVNTPIKVVTEAGGGNSACAVGDPSKVSLHYRTEDGGAFTEIAMNATGAANEWAIDLPGQPNGTVVQYYIAATKDSIVTAQPPRSPDNLYAFYVGPTNEVFFDDFESDKGWTHGLDIGDGSEGQDDWQGGPPNGAGGDPAAAYSGSNVYGNDLGRDGFNGQYQPDIQNWLESPTIDCKSCRGTRLQYRRWVQVEDATFDHARIYVNGTLVWENAMSGGGEKHRLDAHWTFHDIDISQLADGTDLTIRYELQSDAGLEFGGWNIDDVSVVTMAATAGDDPPGKCNCTVSEKPLKVNGLALILVLGLGLSVVVRRRRC